MSEIFRIQVNTEEIANRIGILASQISSTIKNAVKALSIQTHSFLIQKAKTELSGYKQEAFLGPDGKNVRWSRIADGIWVVEIDESARFIEEGRSQTSMATTDWLLGGPVVGHGESGVHRSKDGNLYRSIPFSQAKGRDKGANLDNTNISNQNLEQYVRESLKINKISLTKIEKGQDGSPKLGVLHKIKLSGPGIGVRPDWYSAPRSQEMADLTGLDPHGGIFHGKNLVVTQRLNSKGKVTKEAMTFRTVSTKHQGEGRWMYPEVKAFNSMESAYKWATDEWEKIVKDIESSFNSAST